MEKSTRGDRLRIARERLGLNQSQMAEKLKLPVSTYSAKERAQHPGGRDFKWEDAKEWAPHLKVAVNWLYTGEGVLHNGAHVMEQHTTPIVGWFGVPTGEGSLYGFESERLRRPGFATDLTAALEIKGKSLAEGMYAFFEDGHVPWTGNIFGLAVLGMGGGRIALRKLKGPTIEPYDYGGGTAATMTLDPSKVQWAGKVIAIAPR